MARVDWLGFAACRIILLYKTNYLVIIVRVLRRIDPRADARARPLALSLLKKGPR
jgi:hypothetical protein